MPKMDPESCVRVAQGVLALQAHQVGCHRRGPDQRPEAVPAHDHAVDQRPNLRLPALTKARVKAQHRDRNQTASTQRAGQTILRRACRTHSPQRTLGSARSGRVLSLRHTRRMR